MSLPTTLDLDLAAPQCDIDNDGCAVNRHPGSNATAKMSASHRVARHLTPYLIFALCAGLYVLPFMRLALQAPPEGLLVYGAVRIVHGEVFARDFFEMVGPGSFYWLALFFKVLGMTFVAQRTCLFLTSLATALTMYYLSRRICDKCQTLPCVLLAGTYFGMLWPTISHHVDSNCLALLSVSCMTMWKVRPKQGLLLIAGALAGATTCFLLQKGVLLLFALVLWLWLQRGRDMSFLRCVGTLTGGFVCVVGLMAIYFWSKHALWDLIYANLLWPAKHYSAANVVPYAYGMVRGYWDHFVIAKPGFHWTIASATILIIPFFLVAGLPLLLPILGARFLRDNLAPEVSLYWLCGGAVWISEIHRKDVCHLVFGSPLLIILCVFYIQQYRAKIAGLVLQLLAVSSTCLICFNLFLALSAHPVTTRVGKVWVFKSIPGLDALQARVHPGDEIFAYPYCPMYYFLSETTNPTRYGGLLYNFNTPEQFADSVSVLEQRRVRYVLWDTHFQAKEVNALFPASGRVLPGDLVMEPYLKSHYKVVWADENTRLMERLGEEHAD